MATNKKVEKMVQESNQRSQEKQEAASEPQKVNKVVTHVQRAKEAPIATKFAKQVEGFAAMCNSIAKSMKEKTFTLIQLENKARSLNLATQEAEKNLARLEADSQRAIAMGTAGVRSIAAQVARERDESDRLRERLKLREDTISKQELELQELKSLYETKLEALGKVASAVPGE